MTTIPDKEAAIRAAFDQFKKTSLKNVASYYDFAAGYDAAERTRAAVTVGEPSEYYLRCAAMVGAIREMIGHGYGEGDIEHMLSIVQARNAEWDRLERKERSCAAAPPLASAPDGGGWQPIATAPRDGTWIFLFVPGHGPARARWRERFGWESLNTGREVTKGTHWQPLMALPPSQEGRRMSPAELDFLERVRDRRGLRLADRKEDRVRQKLRRAGLVEVVMNPRRWVITDAGLAVLAGDGGGNG